MAIDKELYERYKKMKAEGANITLAELKAQLEEERNSVSSTPVQTTTTETSTTQYNYEQPVQTPLNTYSSAPQQEPVTPSSYSGNMDHYQPYVSSNYMSQFGTSSVNTVQASAPAQNTYSGNVQQTTPEPSTPMTKFGLIGYPLGHSLSTYIHDAGFKSSGYTDYTYELLETHPESIVDRVKFLKYGGYAGFNVTIPLKLPICVFLDEIDKSADLVGAVNTVVIKPDKTMKGYNTDVTGFVNAIPKDVVLNGRTAGVLGTGGAARAAIAGLITLGVKNFKIYTRNIPNSVDLINYLEKRYPDIKFNPYQIEHIRTLEDLDILVNCTPIGMQGRGAGYSPVEEAELCTLPKHALVYDVVYNPRKTLLIKLAEKNGYRTILGLDMLIYQAVEAQRIWTGKTPDFKDMKIAALENLE